MRNVVLFFVLVFSVVVTGCGAGSDMDGDNNTNPDAPYFESIGIPTVLEGEPVAFTVQAVDPNGMNITLTYDGSQGPYADPFGAGASFNTINGQFSWNTSIGDAGSYSLVFTATNDAVPPASGDVNVTIRVQDLAAYGEDVYNQHCRSCHGADGGFLDCATVGEIEDALGLGDPLNSVGQMSGIANQLDDQTTDINALSEYLGQINPDPAYCDPISAP
jgi:hypothetical protein